MALRKLPGAPDSVSAGSRRRIECDLPARDSARAARVGGEQRDLERRSSIELAVDGDLAAALRHDAATDVEAQARAAFAVPRGEERVEDSVQVRLRDPVAVVRYAHDDPAQRVGLGADAQYVLVPVALH